MILICSKLKRNVKRINTCNNKSLQNTPPYEIHYKNGDFTQSYSSGSVSVDYNFPSKVTNGIHHHRWNIRIGRFCAEEETPVDKDMVHWAPTFMCREAVSTCPYSAKGYMLRKCIDVDGEPTWGRPNFEHCVSQAMKNIFNEAESLRNQQQVNSSSIIKVTANLADVLSKRKSNTSLYPGDLTEATRTVVTLSEVTANASVHSDSLLELAVGYGKAVNEIIDPETTNTWKILAFTTVERKLINILDAVETLSSNIAKKKISLLRRTYRSVHNYSIHDRINVSHENLGKNRNISRQSQYINSDIVSARVLNTPESAYQDLSHPITIVFRVENTTWNSSFQRTCVALNMSDSSVDDRWSPDGCHLDRRSSNATHAVCMCSHMTNFAILMDVFEVQDHIDNDNSMILTVMTYVGCGLSILGCLITVIIFEFFRLKKERIKIHEQLAVSIILVQLVYLVGIDRTENQLNTVVLFVVLRTMMRSITVSAKIGTDERSSVRTGLKAAAVLLPILGLTWILGFFSVDSKETLIFTYLFTFLNSLQVKTAFERRSQRKSRSSLSATLGKSNKNDRLIDNRKSSTSDTSMTEVSLSKSTPPINGISQNEAGWENYGYDHPPEFFTRSFSDGIPSWKNINNLRALHTHYQTTDDIYASHNITHPIDVQQSIEAIYSKPLKRRDRENHVHFNDDMELNGRKTGTIDSPILHLNGPYNNMFEKNWSKSFLAEIQEKANNIKLRNSLAIENGRLEV
uniref:Latrophilin-3 n=1 Tax=Magallana gigas TaxID=29159 RepID=K1QVG1_MAGGI